MPKRLHRKLAAKASAKGYKGARWKRYVYGTLNRIKRKRKH